MKIIRQGNSPRNAPSDIKYTFTCRNCKTKAIAEGHEGRDEYDHRSKDSAKVFKCPCCSRDVWVWYR